jgi:hypothetical protein
VPNQVVRYWSLGLKRTMTFLDIVVPAVLLLNVLNSIATRDFVKEEVL